MEGPPLPPWDAGAAPAFMWGANTLFAGLAGTNERLGRLEACLGTLSASTGARESDLVGFRAELEQMRGFATSVLARVKGIEDFLHGPMFLDGVQKSAAETVLVKCSPEIWRMRDAVERLKAQVERMEDKIGATASTLSPSPSSAVMKDLEDVILRLAAFGEERIEHLEIIGDSGKRNKDGSAKRVLVSESVLEEGIAHPKLPVPRAWKTDSDARTINKNFDQVSKMMNIVLSRIDHLEERLDARLDNLDKQVHVLKKLFEKVNEKVNEKSHGESPKEEIQKEESEDDLGGASTPEEAPLQMEEVFSKQSNQSMTSTIKAKATAAKNHDADSPSKRKKVTGDSAQKLSEKPKKQHQSGAKAARAAFNRSQRKDV